MRLADSFDRTILKTEISAIPSAVKDGIRVVFAYYGDILCLLGDNPI